MQCWCTKTLLAILLPPNRRKRDYNYSFAETDGLNQLSCALYWTSYPPHVDSGPSVHVRGCARYSFHIDAFVVLPDHIRAVWALAPAIPQGRMPRQMIPRAIPLPSLSRAMLRSHSVLWQ